jgi:hypothetical protein
MFLATQNQSDITGYATVLICAETGSSTAYVKELYDNSVSLITR